MGLKKIEVSVLKKLSFLLTFLLLISKTLPVVAETTETSVQAPAETEQTTTLPDEFYIEKHPGNAEQQIDQFYGEFFKMITMLGLIILLLLFISWFVKKMMSSRIEKMTSSSLIQVIERRPLTPRSTLYILEIMGKKIVVAETQSGLTTLTEISSKAPYPKELKEL